MQEHLLDKQMQFNKFNKCNDKIPNNMKCNFFPCHGLAHGIQQPNPT